MPMTRTELQSLHEKLCAEARETQTKKNHDYASESDIFRNFRYFGGLGILVRMSDKLARLRSFEENGVFKVEDEKLADTIQDLINYAVIYYAFKQDGKPTPPTVTTKLGPIPVVKVGPFCGCARIARYRLDRNNEDTEYFCQYCVRTLPPGEQAAATLMETA
jgi:hypothetical protein